MMVFRNRLLNPSSLSEKLEVTSINVIRSFKSIVPMLVAINKCDKYMDQVPAVKRQLLDHGIEVEDIGGDVQVIPISATTVPTNVNFFYDQLNFFSKVKTPLIITYLLFILV